MSENKKKMYKNMKDKKESENCKKKKILKL